MVDDRKYLMENDEETLRLELKTDFSTLERQAIWAGIKPGMRIADIGCGTGKTTSYLHKLVVPFGECVGVDASEERIAYAQKHYCVKGIEFNCKDILEPLDDLGQFDFIWVRFLLEYYRKQSFDIVRNLSKILKPGGILCVIDLDYNCITHYGLASKLERTLCSIMHKLEEEANFDPYIGRKLYSFLYDCNYEDIDVLVNAHNLIFGKLKDVDAFNFMKKVEVATKSVGYEFKDYAGGYEEFLKEFKSFFADPRRFTYSPIIACRGRKPSE